MAARAPAKLLEGAELLEATARPLLEKLGARRVDVVALGRPGWVKYWVGYELAPGVERTRKEMEAPVVLGFPQTLSYVQLSVVPVEELPDEAMEEQAAAIRRPAWGTRIGFGLFALVFLGVFASPVLFGRGKLIVAAPLRGAGSAEARFNSDGEPVELWASLDGSWTGTSGGRAHKTLAKILPVHYEIDVVQGDQVVRHLSLDTQVGRPSQKLRCTVGSDCEVFIVDLPVAAGPVLLRVAGTPREDVTEVTDMSLNVREGTFF